MIGRLLVGLGAAGLTVLLSASSAAAAALEYNETTPKRESPTCQILVNAAASAGVGCFQTYGDVFWVGDSIADGRSVAVYWKLGDDSRRGLVRNKDGSAQVVLNGGWGYANKNLPEGKRLGLRLGTCDAHGSVTCHEVDDYTWVSGWVWGSTG
ncbi:hypothetical protein [Angustibacter luteus]|uniref:Secreted protein n=1 Tax=Angustibacter luteus TaxID=658456 RepID=A0ABW1JIW4_9ACTN